MFAPQAEYLLHQLVGGWWLLVGLQLVGLVVEDYLQDHYKLVRCI
jgi:hypothetical protein